VTVATADPRQVRREAKLAQIVAEAWTLARSEGLAVLSLRDLANRVGLRQPSLYVYFASKSDLYDELFADGYRQLLDFVRAKPLGSRSGDPRRALARFAAGLVQFSSDDIVRHQLLFQRTIPGFEPSPQSYALAVEFYDHAVELLAAAGVHAQSDVDVFTALIAGLGHQQIANDPGGKRWVRQAGRVVELFLADVDRRRSRPHSKGNATWTPK
jgi:AcrR family transcriptional regulator